MFDLLPQIIIIASIAGIIIIIVRKLPALSSVPDNTKISDINKKSRKIKVPSLLNRLWLKIKSFKYSDNFHKILELTEKILRKLKVVFLKVENKISQWAEMLRQHSQKVKARREGVDIEIKTSNGGANNIALSSKKQLEVSDAEKEAEEMDALEEKYIEEITKNPRNIEAYRKLGNLYIKKNSVNDAREAFRQILKLNPSDKDAGLKLMKLRVRKVKRV